MPELALSGATSYAHCTTCGVFEPYSRLDEPCDCGAGPLTYKYLQHVRNRKLYLAHPVAPDAGQGTCSWCGEPIEFVGKVHPSTRRRARHYGDEKEAGSRNCRHEFLMSFASSARELVEKRGDVCCVDCGSEGKWEADHEIPLADGGDHAPENIKRRCVPCHRDKTRREATNLAANSKDQKGQNDG